MTPPQHSPSVTTPEAPTVTGVEETPRAATQRRGTRNANLRIIPEHKPAQKHPTRRGVPGRNKPASNVKSRVSQIQVPRTSVTSDTHARIAHRAQNRLSEHVTAYAGPRTGGAQHPRTIGYPAKSAYPARSIAAKSSRVKAQARETRRVPLALSLVRPRSWSPVALVGVFVAIPLTLVFILMLNILIATRQYDLVDLRTQEQTLTQENQALQQEIGYQQAPQNLANRASSLGMHATDIPATLDINSGQINGTATPVAKPKDDAPGARNLVDAPAVPSQGVALRHLQRRVQHRLHRRINSNRLRVRLLHRRRLQNPRHPLTLQHLNDSILVGTGTNCLRV